MLQFFFFLLKVETDEQQSCWKIEQDLVHATIMWGMVASAWLELYDSKILSSAEMNYIPKVN